MWIAYAFGSALFAGLTSILAKCGIKKTDSNAATALRTIVVLVFSWLMVLVTGANHDFAAVSGKTWCFLILSGLATGASWLCYFKALQLGEVNKVVPIDKSSTILTILLALIFFQEGISLTKGVAIVAIAIIVACNIWGKGMVKIIPILLGVIGSYVLAVIFDADVRANLVANVSSAKWFALPIKMEQTVFGLFASGNVDTHMLLTAVITIVPLSLATMVEHIGDVSAISSTCNRNYIENPGLHRTLMGDGLATTLAALFGAPANTTYGENTGVLALSRIYDPRVIRIAAVLAMLFSFSPKFAAIISSMPSGTIGGVSLVLYGMISAVGVRNVVENKVDFTKSRNVLVAALILVLSIGISYSSAGSLQLGAISLSGLAVGSIVGIVLNAIMPGKDYVYGEDKQGDESVNFIVQ